MGFSRQEHWSELPFSPPGDLPDPEISLNLNLLCLLLWRAAFLVAPPGKPTLTLPINILFSVTETWNRMLEGKLWRLRRGRHFPKKISRENCPLAIPPPQTVWVFGSPPWTWNEPFSFLSSSNWVMAVARGAGLNGRREVCLWLGLAAGSDLARIRSLFWSLERLYLAGSVFALPGARSYRPA